MGTTQARSAGRARTLAKGIIGSVAVAVAVTASAGTALADHVEPTPVGDNWKCEEIGLAEVKAEPLEDNKEYSDGTLTVYVFDFDEPAQTFSWSSNIGVDAVFVKGGEGGGGNLYTYDPEAMGDTGLHAPIHNDLPFDISHVSFCYDVDEEPEQPGEEPEQPGEEPEQPGDGGEQPTDGDVDTSSQVEVLSASHEANELPRTGGNTAKVAALGAALLALGTLMVRESKRLQAAQD
ncbi:MAG: LPXTG cell wall anchor domain-containing protein [Candidatus Binatia bacterium]